jgi:hypothetical protein
MPEEKEIPNPTTREEHDSGTTARGYHEAGTTTDAWAREEEEERARVPRRDLGGEPMPKEGIVVQADKVKKPSDFPHRFLHSYFHVDVQMPLGRE